MKFINFTMKRPEFAFRDAKCIGLRCFRPIIQDGGSGTCNNVCPDPLPEYDKETAARNKAAGWRVQR